MTTASYTLGTNTTLSHDAAIDAAHAALAAEGFGVLCTIDVQATMKAKLDIDREPYTILGACNPPLAHEALSAEPEIGALLPCNVVVYVENGTTRVSAIDAGRMLSIVDRDDLAPIAAEVRARLERVIAAIPSV